MTVIEKKRLALLRLHQQGLVGGGFAKAGDVVGWLGAMQAQDYAGAKWSVGMRMAEATDATVEDAFNGGTILRTHVMRPTWHFVAPDDIRWLLELTAPRVNVVNGTMYRRLGLDEELLRRCEHVLEKALQCGKQLTREEVGAALDAAGIPATGMRLGYVLHRAELDGLICSGPRKGKQFTYVLLGERAPNAKMLARDEALGELTRRYFVSHGPATAPDFVWWSGLTVADVKRGLEIVEGELGHAEIEGRDYWFAAALPDITGGQDSLFLLPTYDELLMGLALEARKEGIDIQELIFDSMILAGGRIAGTWRRVVEKGTLIIQVAPTGGLAAEDERIGAAAARYGAFVGMPVEVRAVDAGMAPMNRLRIQAAREQVGESPMGE